MRLPRPTPAEVLRIRELLLRQLATARRVDGDEAEAQDPGGGSKQSEGGL